MIDQVPEILTRLEAQDEISGHNLRELRLAVFNDHLVSWQEADRLFSLHNSNLEKPGGWSDFFATAITAFLVRQSNPIGVVDKTKVSWFFARATEIGFIESKTEFRILQSLLTEARETCDNLVEFALEQVKNAMINGSGYIGRNRALKAKRIGPEDIDLIEKILYASGPEDHVAVTPKQAQMLFEINDICTAEEDTRLDWQSLFVNAVTNSVMFCDDSRAADEDPQTLWESFTAQDFEDQASSYLAPVDGPPKRTIAITESESAWLAERFQQDNVVTVNERALLRHLGKMCPDIHPSLMPYIEAAA